MAHVLCSGSVPALMQTRKMILEDAGHTVVPVTSVSAAEGACREHKFQVAVIGQGLTATDKRKIAEAVRRYAPTTKILELHTASDRVLKEADDWLLVPAEVPAELATRVAALAGEKPNKRRPK